MSANRPPITNKAGDILNWITETLDNADVFFGHGAANAMDEAVWMICHVSDWSFEELDTHVVDENLFDKHIENLSALLSKRIKTKNPLACLINEAWFNPQGLQSLFVRQRERHDQTQIVWRLWQFAIWYSLFIESAGTEPAPQSHPIEIIADQEAVL